MKFGLYNRLNIYRQIDRRESMSIPFVPSAIACSFFGLQIPDFEWKFVWTIRANFDKLLKNKMKSCIIYRIQDSPNRIKPKPN